MPDQKAVLEATRKADIRAIQAKHPHDLVKRIRALRYSNRIDWADTMFDKVANITRQTLTDMNLVRIFDAMFIGTAVGDIHCDTSRRAIVDESGVAVDDIWSPRALFEAVQVCDLYSKNNSLTMERIIRVLRKWALEHKFNDISERVRVKLEGVEWDGAAQMESYLIETLGLEDSTDNRMFSKYWILSLYNRVMNPGCLAPISMAMFGSQDAGKSHFQNVHCRELLSDPKAAPVTFDPDRQLRDLCRDIYGNSIIATIPEMTGYGKADVKKMKAILTGTTDTFDQKYGFSSKWPRQFIFVMDGNSYEGLYRDGDDEDEDGNSQGERRWFPVFVGQIPGATGKVRWNQEFRVDFGPQFAARLWQVMKECELWMDEHGMDGYEALVHQTTAMVKEFSRKEKNAGHGIVKDAVLDTFLPKALYRAVRRYGKIGDIRVGVKGEKENVNGLYVLAADLILAFDAFGRKVNASRTLTSQMRAIGALCGRTGTKGNDVSAFVFPSSDEKFPKPGAVGSVCMDDVYEWFWDKYIGGGEMPHDEHFGKTIAELNSDDFAEKKKAANGG